jgi:hypothetical protein
MRRALAIAVALLVVATVAQSAMAQEAQDSVSNRLLEILKERQVISPQEYGELKNLAKEMQEDQADLGRRLTDLDRSIADYLAQGGAAGANASYTKGTGFKLATGDGLFELNIGGFFQFEFTASDNDNMRDTNSFNVDENFVILQGHAFDPNLTYYIEAEFDGMVLRDAYFDYVVSDWANMRMGQFKVPFGRQNWTHESDYEFMERAAVCGVFNMDRDVGISLFNTMDLEGAGDTIVEYNVGIMNGEGRGSSANDNNRVAWYARAGLYPMGYIDYSEGDFAGDDEMKFGIAGTYGRHKTHPRPIIPGMGSMSATIDGWQGDAVFTWSGFFLTGEWFDTEIDYGGGAPGLDTQGWYVQAGYMIPDSKIEIVGRYGRTDFDNAYDMDMSGKRVFAHEMDEWTAGVNYYMDGHNLKIGAYVGQMESTFYSADDAKTTFLNLAFQVEW